MRTFQINLGLNVCITPRSSHHQYHRLYTRVLSSNNRSPKANIYTARFFAKENKLITFFPLKLDKHNFSLKIYLTTSQAEQHFLSVKLFSHALFSVFDGNSLKKLLHFSSFSLCSRECNGEILLKTF